MSIELRTGRNGKLRPMWYGRYEVGGKRYTLNLGIKVAGEPPASLSLRDEGNGAFERSRAAAQAKLDHIIDETRRKPDSAHLVERLYEIKTGEQIQSIELDMLPDEWAKIPRRRLPSPRYAAQCRSTLARFATFVRGYNAKAEELGRVTRGRGRNAEVEELGHVTRQMARAFMDAEAARGVTAKTWNDTLKLLRATCKYLLPAGSINPFSGIPTRETDTVFRKPFNPVELKAIVDEAQDDDFIRPIIITGICTAMRRGDCCQLKWQDVDLRKGFIAVKTSKTGQTVSIPIFPMLHDELSRWPVSDYVFPEQAAMYRENPDGITHRVRKVFAAAGFKDKDKKKDTDTDKEQGQEEGEAKIRGAIHAEREGGLRRASLRDFHSFRVTWVTLALTAGVPLELVQKVTGHKTAEIVLKHYFQPGKEAFKSTLQAAMPRLLTNGQKTPKDEMLEILEATTAKKWKQDAARLRELVEGM